MQHPYSKRMDMCTVRYTGTSLEVLLHSKDIASQSMSPPQPLPNETFLNRLLKHTILKHF